MKISWIHSPARYNRHVFTYQQVNDSQDRFTIPVTMSSTADGYTQENRLYMFNLFNKDASDSASIMNSGYLSGGINNWWSNNDRQRQCIMIRCSISMIRMLFHPSGNTPKIKL